MVTPIEAIEPIFLTEERQSLFSLEDWDQIDRLPTKEIVTRCAILARYRLKEQKCSKKQQIRGFKINRSRVLKAFERRFERQFKSKRS